MSNDLAVSQRPEMAQAQQQFSAMSLLHMAVTKGADVDTIERLAKLQGDMQARDAEMGFNTSLHAAQSEMRRIGADATNPQTRSKYLTYAKLDGALRPIYTRHGLSISFNTNDTGKEDVLRVLAYVSHSDGHTRTYQIDMPADGKGAKGNDVMTRTHATGAAASYGMRYLLKMIFNVAVGETDDDGNGATKMHEAELVDRLDAIAASQTMEELQRMYTSAYKAAQSDREAQRDVIAAKDKRKGELKSEAA